MGISERKHREKEQKKNLILDCAERLFFSKGYKDTSVDDIANCAEYSKGTIYLYFKSKDEIFMYIFHRAISLMYKMFKEFILKENNGIDKLRAIGEANFEFANKFPNYHYMMKLEDSLEINYSEIQDILMQIEIINNSLNQLMVDVIKLGQKDGSIRSDISSEVICILLQSMSSGVFQFFEKHKKSLKPLPLNVKTEDYFNGFFEIIGNGIEI